MSGGIKRRTTETFDEMQRSGVPVLFTVTDIAFATGASKSVITYSVERGTLEPDARQRGGWVLFKPETVKAWADAHGRRFKP